MHCYFTCYDPAWSRYSPGALLFTHAISWAIDNGLEEFDFMRGEEPFKRHYATGVRELPTFGFARNARGTCGCFVCRVYFTCEKRIKTFAKTLPPQAQKHLLVVRKACALAAGART